MPKIPEPRKKSDLDYFEKHSGKFQFFLVIITLLALLISWYFSYQNLKLSTNQFKIAITQLTYQRQTDSINKINDLTKEVKLSKQIRSDSITQAKRNARQDKLNFNQIDINRQQLSAMKSQATTALNQLNRQIEEYKKFSFERQPFFMIDNINIDSTLRYKPKISFVFSNKGASPAHVDSTILAFFNLPKGCHSVTRNPGNLDATSQQNFLSTSYINIYDDCLKSPLTIYYLVIYYRTFTSQEQKHESMFFQWDFNKQRQFLYNRHSTKNISEEFKRFLNKQNVKIYD